MKKYADIDFIGNINISGSLIATASLAENAVSSSYANTAQTTNLSYAHFTFNSVPTSNGDWTPIIGESSGITVSGTQITLQKAGTYLLHASLGIYSVVTAYGWVNTSNSQLSGTNLGASTSPTSTQPHATTAATGIITVGSNTIIKIRNISVVAGAGSTAAYSGAYILQLR